MDTQDNLNHLELEDDGISNSNGRIYAQQAPDSLQLIVGEGGVKGVADHPQNNTDASVAASRASFILRMIHD